VLSVRERQLGRFVLTPSADAQWFNASLSVEIQAAARRLTASALRSMRMCRNSSIRRRCRNRQR
jgi:hypothetical protein